MEPGEHVGQVEAGEAFGVGPVSEGHTLAGWGLGGSGPP